jgi:hypothetical protein
MASLVLKMSVSLDGYVAPLDGSTDWIRRRRLLKLERSVDEPCRGDRLAE